MNDWFKRRHKRESRFPDKKEEGIKTCDSSGLGLKGSLKGSLKDSFGIIFQSENGSENGSGDQEKEQ